jgi:hypothetical protein
MQHLRGPGWRGHRPQLAERRHRHGAEAASRQRNYEIRKNLLKYDDVVNDQRKAVFEQRSEFMNSSDLSEIIAEMRQDTVEDLVVRRLPPKAYAEQWDIEGLDEHVRSLLGLEPAHSATGRPRKEWPTRNPGATLLAGGRTPAPPSGKACSRPSTCARWRRASCCR